MEEMQHLQGDVATWHRDGKSVQLVIYVMKVYNLEGYQLSGIMPNVWILQGSIILTWINSNPSMDK